MNDWLQQQYSGAYNPGSNSGSNPSLPSGSHQLELNPHLPPLFFHPSFPTDHSQQTLVSSRSSTERPARVRGSSASSTASSLDSITSSTASCSASSAATSFEHTTSLFGPGERLIRRDGSCEMGKGSSRSRERSASFWDEEKADVLSTSDGCAALTNSLGLLLLNLQDRSQLSNPESTQSYSGPTSRHSSISTDSDLSYASSNSRSPSPIAESPHLQPLNIYSSSPSPLELSPPTSPRVRNIRPDEIKMPDSPLKNRRNSLLSLPEPGLLPTLPPNHKPQRPRREKCGAPEAQFLLLPLSVGAIHFNSPIMGPLMELGSFEEVDCLDLYSDTMLLDTPPPYHPVRQTNYLPTPPCDSPARKVCCEKYVVVTPTPELQQLWLPPTSQLRSFSSSTSSRSGRWLKHPSKSMANLPSHMRSLFNVNERTNLPTNSTTAPSVSIITPLSPTLPHQLPPPQLPPPRQAPTHNPPTDINALRTKAALDNVKIVLRDVGKVLQGVRQGEKEMMDKVGELKVGMDRSIESSGREAIRIQQSGIQTLTAQILTQHTTLLSSLNSSSALQLSQLNSSLTTTVQDFLSKHNLESSRIIDHSLDHSITCSTKISNAVKALEGEIKSGLARLGDKITEEIKSASSITTGAPGSNVVLRIREEARKEKDQALFKSLEEMKVGFDRIASALVQFMEAGERVAKESEDRKNEERREAVKRHEDSESRWMREVERRRIFEESEEEERKVLSLKFERTEAGLESLSKQVSNLSAQLIPLITLLPRFLPNAEMQPQLDTTSRIMHPFVSSSQIRTPSQPSSTQNSKQSSGKFSSVASSSSHPRLSATQGSSRDVFTTSEFEKIRSLRRVADDLSPSSLPAFDSSPRFDGTVQPIKIAPSHNSNSAPQLNALNRERENVPHGTRSISSAVMSSWTGASAAIVVRKSSLKRRRILDDFESSDESTLDRLHTLGSQRSLGDARKTSIDIERIDGALMDSEPARKKGGKRVIEQEAESQSQAEFEVEEVSGKENEVDEAPPMGQDAYEYEEEPDTEEESP